MDSSDEPRNDLRRQNHATGRRCAVVTGGASGIGRALAEALAVTGVGIVVADRQAELAEQVAFGIRARGGAARAAELDVRDLDCFRKIVQDAFAESGRLDYLFNNAGIVVSGEIGGYEPADWDDVIDVNLRGVTHGVLAAYPLMIEQGFGHIVNTASMAGLMSSPAMGGYTVTKHAVVALSRVLRIEARRHGVRVSVLCPGVIRTPILEGGHYGRLKLAPALIAGFFERLRPMDPALFARRALRAVERNRGIIIEPPWWRLFWYIDRLSPRLADKFAEGAFHRMRRKLERLQGS